MVELDLRSYYVIFLFKYFILTNYLIHLPNLFFSVFNPVYCQFCLWLEFGVLVVILTIAIGRHLFCFLVAKFLDFNILLFEPEHLREEENLVVNEAEK